MKTVTQLSRDRWRAANRAREIEKQAEWRANNRARHRAMVARWKQLNKARVMESVRFRQAQKQRASPAWLTAEDREQMVTLYECAIACTRAGFPTEVDHTVPLLGKLVSGLHVPWNLQLLSTPANRAKSNKV